jgi:hypothetical protein
MGHQENDEQRSCNRPITDEAIFKASKEIVVKFIETGRLSPATFSEVFKQVYSTVKITVRGEDEQDRPA